MTPGQGPQALRALMARGFVAAPGVCDAFTARLVARQGYEALYLGGNALGLSYAKGQPLITLTETVDQAARIVRAVDLPLIVDAGAGFGGPAHAGRTVLEIESTGAAGLHIDDQPYPKSPSYHRGHGGLAPLAEAVDRFKAAVRARRNASFLIIARTDSYRETGSLEAVIERGRAYAAAGADALITLDLPLARAAALRAAVPGLPLVWIGGFHGETPTFQALAEAPFDIAVYPMNTVAAIAEAVSGLWAAAKVSGAPAQDPAFLEHWRAELSDIAGMPAYWALEDELAAEREASTS
ncbi:MAG TPA: isocitrate lyase/PEP mutase family protein [Caulobacteraceae bacterium]|nr:isocitrate lyase/PEP mutase family protein [Caulobacteraceae bacterium]